MMEESVKLALGLSIPIWAAMAVFVIIGGIYGGVSGLGIAFAAIFFATIFWFVAVAKVLGERPEEKTYKGPSTEARLAVIEDRLNQIIASKKE